MHILKALKFFGFCLAAVFLFGASTAAVQEKSHILVLHSYHESLPWSKGLMKGIEEEVGTSPIPIETHVEYLDNLRKPAIRIESEQVALFAKKYGHISMKAILTTDDVALDFILRNRAQLFADVPVVFCAPNDFMDSRIAGYKDITGVAEKPDIRGSLDLIMHLHPGTKQIAVVSDQRVSTRNSLLELARIIPEYENQVNIIVLTNESLDQLKKELTNQPPKTVVLFFEFLIDSHGKPYGNNLEVLSELTRDVALPFYTCKKMDVGNGAVGGMVVSEERMAQLATAMVIRILEGVSAVDIPILYKTPPVAMFDYRLLKKFDIKPSLLPEHSLIIHKPSSFYYQYKERVWIVIGFCIFSIILIIFLSINVQKRIVLEKKLRKHSGRLEVIVKERTAELVEANTHLKQEVMDRKIAEKIITQSENTLKSIFKVAPTGIGMVRNRVILQINDKLCEMVGYSREELMGKNSRIFYPSDEEYEYVGKEKYAQIKKRGTGTVETRWQHKTGAIINVLLSSTPINEKDWLEGVTFTALDISERKRSEKALKESEKKYRTLIETTDTGFVFVDEKGSVLEANQTYVKMTGHSLLDDILGRSVIEWTAPYDLERNLKEVQKCFSTGEVRNLEIDYIHPDGTIMPIEIFAKAITAGEGDTMITLCRDISERNLAQKEKIQAQHHAMTQEKHALIGQIAGKMAHDFNNILGVIMGNTELSLLDCRDIETKKTLELILGQTVRGKNLTKNLIAFAKGQEPKQEYFKIKEKIDLVVSLLKKDLEGIRLIRQDAQDVPELLADPGMIEHAMVNLIQNSIHAVSKTEDPQIVIRTYSHKNRICFEIEDNGCGIPKEHLNMIYQPSFTLKGSRDLSRSYRSEIKGTGYGMANVKKYIDQHKGQIRVISHMNTGTQFTIDLPVIKKELTVEEKIEIQSSTVQHEKYILLVEDETSISDVQYRILTQTPFHHKVDKAFDGERAMALYDANPYDFISLDYVLPGKFSGMDVYTHIRKTDQKIPILFVSGNIEFLESIKDLKTNDPFIDHLSKPCQNRDYVGRINDLIEKALLFPKDLC